MNSSSNRNACLYVGLSVALLAAAAAAQPPAPLAPPLESDKPTMAGSYEIRQTIEFGGHATHFGGNSGMWDTFVNLGTGPRLLDYTLDLHSPNHNGLLFDDLTFTNFGYGGDPNNVSRLRILKSKYYNFTGTFRRDVNVFDYDLFANPLNPSNSNPNLPVLQSPHEMFLVRRMTDLNLTLLPVSKVRFRLGWSRVTNQGTSFTTYHEGTETLLDEPTLNITDTYRLGVTFKVRHRTSLQFDEMFTHFKGDTSATLASSATMAGFGFPSFQLAGNIPVNLGLPFNTGATTPCAAPVLATGFANPTCNGYLSFVQSGRTRNSFPTEQASFQSSESPQWDFSGKLSYTDATANLPSYDQFFNGLVSRSAVRTEGITGASTAKHIALNGDFAATYHATEKLRIVDTLRYSAFRNPGSWSLVTADTFGASLLVNPNTFSTTTCPSPFTGAGCPQHTSSSSADLTVDNRTDFMAQQQTINTFELEYDFTPKLMAHLGHRYEHREITDNVVDYSVQTFLPTLPNRGACAGIALSSTGTCTTTVPSIDNGNFFVPINSNSAIGGFTYRPNEKFRFTADAEIFYADNVYTRISPRHLQDYRWRAVYKPLPWVNLGSTIRIQENRNNTAAIGNLQHNRNYAFNAVMAPPSANWGFDFSYSYQDIFSQTNICFVSTPAPLNSLSCGSPYLQGLSYYTELAHNGSTSFFFKPASNVTAGVGYTITSTAGNTLILNPIAPTGPLSYNYHLPMVSLAAQLSKHVSYKSSWSFYDYHEKSAPGPTLPRGFHGGVITMSLRYSL